MDFDTKLPLSPSGKIYGRNSCIRIVVGTTTKSNRLLLLKYPTSQKKIHQNSLTTFWVDRQPDKVRNIKITRSSADADNRLDAFSGQSMSTNMVPFHMLHIVSYSNFAIVTLSLIRAVFTIFVFKKFHDLEMGVKGHARSLRVISFHRLCMVSY